MGAFRFHCNIMGLISAGYEALMGLENVQKLVKNIIVDDRGRSSHIARV